MTRLSVFNSPLLLGFEQFEQALDRVSRTASDGYPPYNVEQTGEHSLRITIAVAGFDADDLQVQVESTQLVIRGKRRESEDRVYLHRGIAARQFQRTFVVAEGIEVVGASLDNGMLHIDLERPTIEPDVRTIAIKTNAKKRAAEPIKTISGASVANMDGGSEG